MHSLETLTFVLSQIISCHQPRSNAMRRMPSLNVNATQWLSTNIIKCPIASSVWELREKQRKRKSRKREIESTHAREGCWEICILNENCVCDTLDLFRLRLPRFLQHIFRLPRARIYSSHEARLRNSPFCSWHAFANGAHFQKIS